VSRKINRLRVGVGQFKENQVKWGLIPNEYTYCNCGQVHTMTHLIIYPSCPTSCKMDDIMTAMKDGIDFQILAMKNLTHNVNNTILHYQTTHKINHLLIY